jgi:hypothetical protein
MAEAGGAITINFDEQGVLERLSEPSDSKGLEKVNKRHRHRGAYHGLPPFYPAFRVAFTERRAGFLSRCV